MSFGSRRLRARDGWLVTTGSPLRSLSIFVLTHVVAAIASFRMIT